MKHFQLTLAMVAAVALASFGSNVAAHPGHLHHRKKNDSSNTNSSQLSRLVAQRMWTVRQSGQKVAGSLLLSRDGQLRLEQLDGSVVTIPLKDLQTSDRLWAERRLFEIRQLNAPPSVEFLALQSGRKRLESPQPTIANFFEPFKKRVHLRWDEDFLYVESNGMPDHPMMVGITAWQQQVPLPQRYTGTNAWQIPLYPVPARQPLSAKTGFFRGAIALAVNGVPIFNPIKNNGTTDTLLAGELDQWGGHCGRADDYHYHIAPVHLEKIVGKGKPVAYALDGYPIYGYADPDGKTPEDLDWLNGHKGQDGSYHYHATKTYPYLNGGFYGKVVEQGGQVDPQPRGNAVRPAQRPLRGAKITGFQNPKPNSFKVEYDVFGDKRSISYDIADDGSVVFRFSDSKETRTEEYTPRRAGAGRREGGQAPRRNDQPPLGQPRNNRPTPDGDRQPRGDLLTRALDTNGDGTIDQAELAKAVDVLKSLDKNGDGNLTRDEFRGKRDENARPNRGLRPAQAGPNRNAPNGRPENRKPTDGPRQPWILVHANEIDLNRDNVISRTEIVGEAEKAFGGFDANKDGKLSETELRSRGSGRSVMGGFIRQHAKELDRDNDGMVSRKEAVDNAIRMFSRMDKDQDGMITKQELESSRRTTDQVERGRKPGTKQRDKPVR